MRLAKLAYMEGWTYVRMVDDVMAIKPKLLASMGYHIFLTMVLRINRIEETLKRFSLFCVIRNADALIYHCVR